MTKDNVKKEISDNSAENNSNCLSLNSNSTEGVTEDGKNYNVEKIMENTVALADSAASISKDIVESRRLKEQSMYNLKKLKSTHESDIKIIDKSFKKQDRMLDSAEKVIDKGIEDNDIEKIRLGLMAGANIANTNPVQDITNRITSKRDEESNDDFIEI